MNTTKRGHPDLLYWVLGYRRKYLYVYYLCKLLTYSHQIFIVGATDVCINWQIHLWFDLLLKVKVTGVKM